jgi:hypothetical protein
MQYKPDRQRPRGRPGTHPSTSVRCGLAIHLPRSSRSQGLESRGGESFTTSPGSQCPTIASIWSTLWCRLTSFVITSRAKSGRSIGLIIWPLMKPCIGAGVDLQRCCDLAVRGSPGPYPFSSRLAQSRSSAESALPPRAITFQRRLPIGVRLSNAPASISPRRQSLWFSRAGR